MSRRSSWKYYQETLPSPTQTSTGRSRSPADAVMDKPPPDDFDPYEREAMFAVSGDSAGRQWIMQLLQALILAGIVALFGIMWSFASSFAEIRVMLNEREKQNARDVARLESADA